MWKRDNYDFFPRHRKSIANELEQTINPRIATSLTPLFFPAYIPALIAPYSALINMAARMLIANANLLRR